MEPEADFTAIVLSLNRSINCLVDDNRSIQLEGIKKITDELPKMKKTNLIKLFTKTDLTKNLLRLINGKIEAHRQKGLEMLTKFI